MTGLVLFAHGARDARWREPFDRLLERVRSGHGAPVELAFLELMDPDLPAAAARLARVGATRIVVVPLFLGTGGHLRRDLPRLLELARATAGVPVAAAGAAGENDAVLDALASYCLRSAR
ncbi:MAG: CbiX/SirB N-terminal domain-containing protein [Burkholderiales bacterium]|nr:CbiX/SirB N-terminal domain-containing protein [Burkholderiales bacterium]